MFFADEQVSGPFAAFRHEHHFGGGEDRTEMVDEVRFSVPFGWPGRAGGLIVLRPYLRWLIEHRNRYLKQQAEAAS